MVTKNQLRLGYLELTLAQCFVGLNVISGKLLIGYFPIFVLLTIRFAFGFVGTLGVARFNGLPFTRIYTNFISLPSKDKILLILQAACGGFLFNVLILYGMKTTTATSAGIITSITPIMIFILAAVFLHEKINVRKGVAIVMVMIGLIVLNVGKEEGAMSGALLGNILVLLAVIPEALFTILSKSVFNKISEMEAVILVNLFNLLMFIPFALFSFDGFQPMNIPMHLWGQVLLYSLSGGIMFFLLWYRGLTKVSANVAALFTGVMPVSTTVLAYLFLNESIQLADILGMSIVILAIFIGLKPK